MNIPEAYKTLGLAKGLGMDCVEAQFTKLKTEMEAKIASTRNGRLKQVYTNRLDEIEEAYAALLEHFEVGVQGVTEDQPIVHRPSTAHQTKASNSKWLLPAAIVFAGVLVSLLIVFLLKAKNESSNELLISEAPLENLTETSSYLMIEGENIWVRDYPTDGEVIMKLNDGNKCKVLQKGKKETIREVTDYWYKIEFEGETGWVFGSQTSKKMTDGEFTEIQEKQLNIFNIGEVSDFLSTFYRENCYGDFNAYNYFADDVDQFISLKNITPKKINEEHYSNNEFLDKEVYILQESITALGTIDRIQYFTFWIDFICYRSSKDKYQSCQVQLEIGLNENKKMVSYKELKVTGLKFSDHPKG